MSAATFPATAGTTAASGEVPQFRLYVLRATYLLIAVGLGVTVWPGVIRHDLSMHSATSSLLAGVAVLALMGLRYPLAMLPLLLFELVWKSIWLIAVAAPLWRAHQLDADTMESVRACVMGVVIMPLAIPWRYVWKHYAMAPGDRWR